MRKKRSCEKKMQKLMGYCFFKEKMYICSMYYNVQKAETQS